MGSLGTILSFLNSQLFVSLPRPTQSFAGKTVIVTGSNVGLGKEAARHFTRLGASTVILAVRSLEKGEAAKQDIDQSTGCGKDVVKVWHLDLASYQSVKDFAARANKELSRLDVLLENAAIATHTYAMAEDNERTITVNVVSTFLLTFLMLPKLKETSSKFNTRPVLSIVSSEAHIFASFPERNAPDGQIYKMLNEKQTTNMPDRYPVSKLLEIFGVRTIAEKVPADSYPVTVNCLNPGLCHS
jgi:NAD(P)-dependent dehydrogenase (short-subunit alcohol dehydrogenase family)